MTGAQFDALAKLLRSRAPALTAARLVLVDGSKPSEAARATGMQLNAVSNAVARFRAADELILQAYSADER